MDTRPSYQQRVSRPKRLLIALAITAVAVLCATAVGLGPFRDDAATAGPTQADVWCYTLSTAAGFYMPVAGAASGAACMFLPEGNQTANIRCHSSVVRLGNGQIVAAYGSGSYYGTNGVCHRGWWGTYNNGMTWTKFR